MARGACAVALLCALVVAGGAAYTVDCNHEYTDCDTELSKLTNEDDDPTAVLPSIAPSIVEVTTTTTTSTSTISPTRSTPTLNKISTNKTEELSTTEAIEYKDSFDKPRPRLLNLSVDELQNFANALHNQTKGPKKLLGDLSDVNLDGDDDDEPPRMITNEPKNKQISDKFYTNLQAPFNPLLTVDRSEEIETCKDNEVSYKIGERIDRGCDETCECSPGGNFECTPRCKHPYIRRGRRLDDPLCFESPVDMCCSIVTCATGNGETKPSSLEVCRYGNDSHAVGTKWNIECEQTCTCEPNSIVTCKPRCERLRHSEKCINVQDPNDECCEVQVCDVSQDVHEEPAENMTSSTSTTTTIPRVWHDLIISPIPTMRPLVLAEPIGSITVLQNNSVQVNLMHMNNSEDPIHLLLSSDGGKTYSDVELKYSNLILNLEGGNDYILKTKETGTNFNFTITAMDDRNEVPVEEKFNETKIGCSYDGRFYNVGDEFKIQCLEVCECTGQDTHECAPLVCPSHVGLELVSRSCVEWEQGPPPQPPNCCPRTARCLSDGTCHFKGHYIPNWSEVPLSVSGCEQRCFCENGVVDCQEACNPLPALPPQSLRCPPMHRPAPVNISDEDCCKQWGCVPHVGIFNASTFQPYGLPTHEQTIMNYVTPMTFDRTPSSSYLPKPFATTETDFYKNPIPITTNIRKLFKTLIPITKNNKTFKFVLDKPTEHVLGYNITVFTPEDFHNPFKTIHPEPPMVTNHNNWEVSSHSKGPIVSKHFKNLNVAFNNNRNSHREPINVIIPDSKMHDMIDQVNNNNALKINSYSAHAHAHDAFLKQLFEDNLVKKVPLSKSNNFNMFIPIYNKKYHEKASNKYDDSNATYKPLNPTRPYFAVSSRINNTLYNFNMPQNPITYHPNIKDYIWHNHSLGSNKVTLMESSAKGNSQPAVWAKNTASHILTKDPNPYETVLLRAVPNSKTDIKSTYIPNVKNVPRIPSKTYSSLDLEHLLNQMEVESEVNRNLGRSADKSHGTTAAGQIPSKGQPPSFLPTVPPENQYPQEDVPDYDQNNIHRPNYPISFGTPGLPIPGFPVPGFDNENKKLSVLSLQGDSPTSIKMLFGLASVLVGLRGSIDLRYTDTADEDISQWNSQVFAPADEILTTPRLEFRLTGLKPSTTYKIKGKLNLHNLKMEPESDIFTVRTQDLTPVSPLEEKRREIDAKLTVLAVNDTTAQVSWRHFSEDELQLIDGIQVRYRPTGTPIFSMTELLHHSRSHAELSELRPGSRYEASLVLIPPPRGTTELIDPGKVEFTTAPFIDPYNWSVALEARSVGSEAAELVWRGVPEPAERWVRVYRAAHACTAAGKEHDALKLAARDSPSTITLTGLEPDSKCRIWLELFLTNGKVKTSNVLEIHTKSLDSAEPIDNVVEASTVAGRHKGDYYGALVVVGVIAALAALTTVLLLLVVVRRHRPRSVPITSVPSAPRESSLPPYDNPAYKLELQQETMDL